MKKHCGGRFNALHRPDKNAMGIALSHGTDTEQERSTREKVFGKLRVMSTETMKRSTEKQSDRGMPYLQFELSAHAKQRIAERTGLTPDAVLDLLNAGRTLPLNDAHRHPQGRGYHLFVSASDRQAFVAIVRPAWVTGSTGTMISVLTEAQYERDRGPLAAEVLLRAARMVLSEHSYRAVRAAMQPSWRRRALKVVLQGWDADLRPARVVVGTPPVPAAFIAAHGLERLHCHPGFWSWLAQRAVVAGLCADLKVERLEVELGDQAPVVLDLGAAVIDEATCLTPCEA